MLPHRWGGTRLPARGRPPMANAKIISIVDHEISAVMRLTAGDLKDARAQTVHDITAARAALTNAIADNTLNLRHDIKILNDHSRILREDLNALAGALNSLAQELGQLKQGGATP